MGGAGGDGRLLSPGAFQWELGTLRGPVKTHLGAGGCAKWVWGGAQGPEGIPARKSLRKERTSNTL